MAPVMRAWIMPWACLALLSSAGTVRSQDSDAVSSQDSGAVTDQDSGAHAEDSAAPEAEGASGEQGPEEAPQTLGEREGAAFEDTGATRSDSEEEDRGEAAVPPPAAGEPSAGEPPQAEATARREELGFYTSVRAFVGTDTEDVAVRDNASRFGLFGAREFSPGWGLYARSELGVNFLEEFNRFLNPKSNGPEGANAVFLRVGYLGLNGPWGRLALGKQWSPYYAVAVFTDRFVYSGGLAAASFNAGTDGGATGTGRSAGTLLYTLDKSGLGLRLQWQPGGRRIPGASDETYGSGGAGSVLYEWDWGLGLGAGYNRAPVAEITPELRRLGIDGAAEAWIVGLRLERGPVYLGLTAVEHRNHDTDDGGVYFDGRGGEVLLRYSWHARLRLSAGLNYLEPVGRSADLPYDIKVGIFSVEYSLHDPTFKNVVYAQVIVEGSRRADGTSYPNVLVVGGRYSFEF